MASLSVQIAGEKTIKYHYEVDFPLGEITGVFGPTGSGKTSLFRFIAGLDIPQRGYVGCKNSVWFDSDRNLAAKKRGISFVFQKGGLLPHLTVFENIKLFAEANVDLEQILQWCKVTHLQNKKTNELSGGQEQQVALARAMAQNKQLMLLDEPFSALHEKLRTELQQALLLYHRTYPCTILIVSHSKPDLLKLTSKVALVARQECKGLSPVTSLFPNLNEDAFLDAKVFKVDVFLEGIWVKLDSDLLFISVAQNEIDAYSEGDVLKIPIALPKN